MASLDQPTPAQVLRLANELDRARQTPIPRITAHEAAAALRSLHAQVVALTEARDATQRALRALPALTPMHQRGEIRIGGRCEVHLSVRPCAQCATGVAPLGLGAPIWSDPVSAAVSEKGPWTARQASADHNLGTFVESDDFKHDARLYVNGDFRSETEKLDYAKEIATRLNAFAPAPANGVARSD